MSKFESCPAGTFEEIRLSRELVREMEQMIEQYGKGIFPISVLQAYNRLYGHHIKMIQKENYE